jgi:dihydropteroate synthase
VDIINDISGGTIDPLMFDTISRLNVPYILMHIQGLPDNMQNNPQYDDVFGDVLFYLAKKVDELRLKGVSDIIIDPGFGFGKSLEHNYHLMRSLEQFKILELPLLVGVSRKSMINKVLNCQPEDALNGTTVLNTIAASKGANILRVHDVKEAVECVKLFSKTFENLRSEK